MFVLLAPRSLPAGSPTGAVFQGPRSRSTAAGRDSADT